ncbi:MAG: hypothetical protein JNM56_00865 [Planctomycetia bacterium]|nr:hypothetical protein [Planctomycetia bacterium]
MPVLTSPIEFEGALVDVLIGFSSTQIGLLRAASKPIPPPIAVRALIDTGAESTCFDPAILRPMNLPLNNVVPANMPAAGGFQLASTYSAGLTILHPSGDPNRHWVLKTALLLEMPLGVLGYQGLIGRDVLALSRLHYDGPARQFELDY